MPRRFGPLASIAVASIAIASLGVVAAACAPKPTAPVGPVAPTRAVSPAAPDGPTISPSPARHLAAAGTCSAASIDALAMLPASATLVMGVDVPTLVRSPYYSAHRRELEIGGFKRVLELAAACDLGISGWRTLTLAIDGPQNATTIVAQADGLGDRRRLECVRDRAAAEVGTAAAFTLADVDGRIELTLDGATGWVVDPCTLVISEASAAETTRARLRGNSRSALGGAVTGAMGRVGTRRPFWLAAAPVDSLGPSVANARDLAIGLDVDRGFRIDASLAFPDATSARTASTTIEAELTSLRSMVMAFGLPAAVGDSLGVTATGTLVSIRAHGDEAALDGLRQRLTVMFAQMN